MQKGQTIWLAMVVLISILLAACGPSASESYGRASNPDRKARGLPIIPAAWIERAGGTMADWNNPAHADQRTTHDPMHDYKETFIDKAGNPLREDDVYQSG